MIVKPYEMIEMIKNESDTSLLEVLKQAKAYKKEFVNIPGYIGYVTFAPEKDHIAFIKINDTESIEETIVCNKIRCSLNQFILVATQEMKKLLD